MTGEFTAPESVEAPLKALVVDDDTTVLRLLEELLTDDGLEVVCAETIAEGQRLLDAGGISLLVSDRNLPDGSGIELLKRAADMTPSVVGVMVTAHANVDSAVDALKAGAIDFIEKPFADLETVRGRVQHALRVLDLRRRNEQLMRELTERNRELEALAVRDPLTKLFNHAFLQESLEREVHRARRHGHELSLLLIDLDNFKTVNDTLGHRTGDSLLMSFADLLRGSSRRSDESFRLRGQDITARYGGDEFAILLPETPKRGGGAKAELLRASVEQHTFEAVEKQTVSIGVACFPEDAEDRASLVEAADRALYVAKRSGRNRVIPYSSTRGADGEETDASKEEQLQILDEVINRGLVRFVYQPIVGRRGELFGYEALCRPEHPAFGSVLDLLKAAESIGRIHSLGRLLRAKAVEVLPKLPEHVLLFINLHPHEIDDPILLSGDGVLVEHAHRIVLELNDIRSIENTGRVRDRLVRARSVGFRVTADDLGSGYLGLHTLTLLQPDFVRLDMSAVRAARHDPRGQRLIKHIIELAGDEGIQCIAEGVETDDERREVIDIGCPYLQGYAIGKPVDEPAG